ncbi:MULTISPECIES: hypothetical protein [Streptomyces]|nr:hypothetical protein [Streptomyces sp. A1-5]
MRVPDIRIGETYQVKVPQRIPPALRRVPHSPTRAADDLEGR